MVLPTIACRLTLQGASGDLNALADATRQFTTQPAIGAARRSRLSAGRFGLFGPRPHDGPRPPMHSSMTSRLGKVLLGPNANLGVLQLEGIQARELAWPNGEIYRGGWKNGKVGGFGCVSVCVWGGGAATLLALAHVTVIREACLVCALFKHGIFFHALS